MSIEAMKLALEALEKATPVKAKDPQMQADAIVALRTAIEQAEKQEPVAAQSRFSGDEWTQCSVEHAKMVMANPHEWKNYEFRLLYTTPPAQPAPVQEQTDWEAVAADQAMTIALLKSEAAAQRQWVGLEPDEVFSIADRHPVEGFDPDIMAYTRAIEARLREKNGA